MSRLKMVFLSLTMLTLAGVLWASEADELREKARAMQREAAELAERGHREEAENLERNAIKMLEEAEKRERDRLDQSEAKIRELERHLEGLRREPRAHAGGPRLIKLSWSQLVPTATQHTNEPV